MDSEALAYLADIVQIASAVTIIVGIVFALFQISEYRKQRRNAVAGEVMRTFYSPALSDAICLIVSLPDDTTADELRHRGADYERAAVLISISFETMGLLVFERIAPLVLVEELAGGTVVVVWRKLRGWIGDFRAEQSQPSWGEWFEWLALLCDRRKTGQEPAYSKYRDWQP
ncbi:MAG: hypothetical protein PVJ40_09575 [Gammaproteobacteria bacterium]|jgi:hypothetical protein